MVTLTSHTLYGSDILDLWNEENPILDVETQEISSQNVLNSSNHVCYSYRTEHGRSRFSKKEQHDIVVKKICVLILISLEYLNRPASKAHGRDSSHSWRSG